MQRYAAQTARLAQNQQEKCEKQWPENRIIIKIKDAQRYGRKEVSTSAKFKNVVKMCLNGYCPEYYCWIGWGRFNAFGVGIGIGIVISY